MLCFTLQLFVENLLYLATNKSKLSEM
jgi:hypothetical protein